MLDNMTEIVLATGALGTASMGIVEGFKGKSLFGGACTREMGWSHVQNGLKGFESIVKAAYGSDAWELLRTQYCGKRGEVSRMLRQGIRIGLREDNAAEAAQALDWDEARAKALARAAKFAQQPIPESSATDAKKQKVLDEARLILGQYEMAVDARIEATLAMAESDYISGVRNRAGLVSLFIALAVGILLALGQMPDTENPELVAEQTEPTAEDATPALFVAAETDVEIEETTPTPDIPPLHYILGSILVGLAAVPLAPIAKDVTKALQSAATALGRRAG